MTSRTEIQTEFRQGAAEQITGAAFDITRSIHWRAGWNAGHAVANQIAAALNEHLVRNGETPIGVIVLPEVKKKKARR